MKKKKHWIGPNQKHLQMTFVAKLMISLLTHYQTTNFRLFQTERVCRRQFQIRRKWQKVIQTGRKHCWQRKNCSLTSNFSFSHSVFKRLVSQGRQMVSLCGNGLKTSMEKERSLLENIV